MVALPDSARALLASAPLAHVVTTNRDGSPQISCTWVSLDGDTLVIASLGEYQKIKNLRRDPRVALSFAAPTTNALGLTEYLVVHGRATIVEGGAPAVLHEQARRYLGPQVLFPPLADNPPPGRQIRIEVDRVSGVGPWA